MRYEFSKEDAFRFAREGCAETRQRGAELQFKICPYCKGGEHHDKYTFSISLDTGQYKCLRSGCDAHGNFITLSRDFDFSLSADMDRYYSGGEQFRRFKKKTILTKDHAVELLGRRGVSEKTVRRYEITVADGKGKDILVFPFFDDKGELRFIKYRNMNFRPGIDKNKEWCEESCMPILFGMKQCNGKFDRLILTEGQIDSLSVAEAGIENAVSVPTGAKGFTWVPYCWDWLTKFQELVIFGDCEKGEITLLEEMRKRFPGTVRCVRQEDYRGCKDANEILQSYGKDAIASAIQNAEFAPIRAVKRLSDVKGVDLYGLPKIKTNLGKLDGLLGGLYFGQLILLSGRRGDGKSTLMSQFIVEAIEQGFPVFIYSGELLDFYFKRWIDLQIAGPQHLVANQYANGTTTYSISNQTLNAINTWYHDKAFLYDNNCIDDDEMEDLLKVIEKAVMQYGIKLVCIDNLMTALDVGMEEDLYRAQSKFVGKLAKLAKLHNIVILLVVHPRKGFEASNDEISGSADITNKADVVMWYNRVKPEAGEEPREDERKLLVTKNRLTGKLTSAKNEIYLYYDEASKRIVGEGQGFKREYGWAADKQGFTTVYDDEPLPFEG